MTRRRYELTDHDGQSCHRWRRSGRPSNLKREGIQYQGVQATRRQSRRASCHFPWPPRSESRRERLLPNKPRGVPRVDDRRVLNGILWRFRTGSPWRDLRTLRSVDHCYNRFVRWRKAGVWDRPLEAVSEAYDGDIVMIDSTCVRIHQQ